MLRIIDERDEQPDVAVDDGPVVGVGPALDELCRLAVRQMIATVLEAKRRVDSVEHAELVDAAGKRLVASSRYVNEPGTTTAGRGEVHAPGWVIAARAKGSSRR